MAELLLIHVFQPWQELVADGSTGCAELDEDEADAARWCEKRFRLLDRPEEEEKLRGIVLGMHSAERAVEVLGLAHGAC